MATENEVIARLRDLGRQAAREGVNRPPQSFGNMQGFYWWEGYCEVKPDTEHPYKRSYKL